jgi:tripartite-type tricarboxylate transporter receptor subunit TctC
MRKIKRILVVIKILGLCLLILPTGVKAASKDLDYPTKPITLYIAFGVGGTTDTVFRSFGDAASMFLGQPFSYINRAGAGGTLAGMSVINAKPDGYTLGSATNSILFIAPFSDESPYRDISGFTPICNIANYIYPFMVKADSPWKNWQEFIEWARKNPKATKIGLAGAKSVSSEGSVLSQIEKREQIEFTYVPFKSSVETFTAALGGHTTVCPLPLIPTSMSYLQEGKFRILAYLGTHKVAGFENVPTTKELYGISIPNVVGIVGPNGLPEYVLEKVDRAFAKAVKAPSYINAMNEAGVSVVFMNRSEMKKYVEETYSKMSDIMRTMKSEELKGIK